MSTAAANDVIEQELAQRVSGGLEVASSHVPNESPPPRVFPTKASREQTRCAAH